MSFQLISGNANCTVCGKELVLSTLFGKRICNDCITQKKHSQKHSASRVRISGDYVYCVCGCKIPRNRRSVFDNTITCPRCAMKIHVPGYATIEVTGINHQEVLEVASEYYSYIKNEETAKSDTNNTDIFSELNLCANIWKALLHLQNSPNRHTKTENELNDVVRDNLRMIYTVHDQTRQGVSESRKGAGALDMLICNSRQLPYAIIEAMKLESVDKAYIKSHIIKALANYDPYGCPYVFIIIYALNNNFNSFCNRLFSYLNDFVFPFETVTKPFEHQMEFSESHHIHTILNRNGEDLSVHFLTINLNQQLQ